MARKLRIQYPGAIYHVMNRGDRREAIFADEADRRRFLETLAEACQKTGWQVHAYCLMSNHFHLVVETPQPNLVLGMKWLLGTYTSRYNRRHKEFGHLFSGRYKALVVDGSGDGYLKTACDYVHLNPVRAKLMKADQALEAFAWSSYRWYLSGPSRRPSWLRVDRLLGEWGVPKDSIAGRREFAERMEWRRGENGRGGIQADEAGLVPGAGGVSAGVAGAGEHAGRSEPFRRGDAGGGAGPGGADGEGGTPAFKVERGRFEGAAQGRTGEGEVGARLAGKHDDAAGMDCGAAEHGWSRISSLATGTGRKNQTPAIK